MRKRNHGGLQSQKKDVYNFDKVEEGEKKSSSHWIDSIWDITVVSVFVGVIVKKI